MKGGKALSVGGIPQGGSGVLPDDVLLLQRVNLLFAVTKFPQDFLGLLTYQRRASVLHGIVAAEFDGGGHGDVGSAGSGGEIVHIVARSGLSVIGHIRKVADLAETKAAAKSGGGQFAL